MPYMIGALPMGEQSPASLSGLKLLGNITNIKSLNTQTQHVHLFLLFQ